MPFKRLFKDKYAGSLPENASAVRTLLDLFRGKRMICGNKKGRELRAAEEKETKKTSSKGNEKGGRRRSRKRNRRGK